MYTVNMRRCARRTKAPIVGGMGSGSHRPAQHRREHARVRTAARRLEAARQVVDNYRAVFPMLGYATTVDTIDLPTTVADTLGVSREDVVRTPEDVAEYDKRAKRNARRRELYAAKRSAEDAQRAIDREEN